MHDDIRRLKRRGVSSADIDLAVEHQANQKRLGAKVLPLGQIVGLDSPSPGKPTLLLGKQLRGKDAGGQAALLARRLALVAKSEEGAADLRQAANLIDRHTTGRTEQVEFDFMEGNVSLAHQYQDAIEERLIQSGKTPAQQDRALSVLWTLTRHIKWQSYEVDITASDLAERKKLDRANLSRTLALLEEVGAIKQVKKGRRNIISITPEGVYRGPIQAHSAAVGKYKLEVLDGGKTSER